MAIATATRNSILNAVFRNTAYTGPATVYVSLHTADPGITGASEASGGSYARQACAFNAAASGAIENTAVEDFTGMPAGTFTHFGLWDAATTGNFLWGGSLSASRTVGAGDTIQFGAGAVDLSLV